MYNLSRDFNSLPECPPYGFIVLEDGQFVIARKLFDHVLIIQSLMGDVEKPIEVFYNRGGVRMVGSINGRTSLYYITGKLEKAVKTKSLSTSKDICKFYKINFEVDSSF